MGMQFVMMKIGPLARSLNAETRSFRCPDCGGMNFQLRRADGPLIVEGRATEADTAALRMFQNASLAGLVPWKAPLAGDPQPIGRSRVPRPFDPSPLERLGVPRDRVGVSACKSCRSVLVDIGYERYGKACIGRGPDLAMAVNDLCNQLWLDVRFGALADVPPFLDDPSSDPAPGSGAPLPPLAPEERQDWLKRIFGPDAADLPAVPRPVSRQSAQAVAAAAVPARPKPGHRDSWIDRVLRLLAP